MKIKTLLVGIFAILLSTTFGASAYAEILSISAGIPVTQTFSDEYISSTSTSGFMVHASIPMLPGLGMEQYDTVLDDDPDIDMVSTTMYDLFYLLPIPIINVTIGAGFGTATATTWVDSIETYNDATMIQYYAQVGFPFFPFLDVHVSYHVLTGTLENTSGGDDISLGGNVIGVGVAFTF